MNISIAFLLGTKWGLCPMRKPSIAVPIVRIRREIYISRTVTRSQTVCQLAVTLHRERYQKRWERNNVPKIVNAMIERSRSQPQFTEWCLHKQLSLPCAGNLSADDSPGKVT